MRGFWSILFALTLGYHSHAQLMTWAKIPFEIDMFGHICLRVSTDQQNFEWFIFDTGFSGTAMLDYGTAQKWGIQMDKSRTMRPKGRGFEVYTAQLQQFYIHNDKGKVVLTANAEKASTLVTVEKESLPLIVIGNQIHRAAGIIGMEIVVQTLIISYDKKALYLVVDSDDEPDSPETEGWTLVSPKQPVESDHPYVEVTFGSHAIPALLDSGWPSGLALNEHWYNIIKDNIAISGFEFIFKSDESEEHFFSSVGLPKARFAGDYFLDLDFVSAVLNHKFYKNFPSILGTLAMIQFNWRIDKITKQVYLQPRQNPPRASLKTVGFLTIESRDGKVLVSSGPRTLARRAGIEHDCTLLKIGSIDIAQALKAFPVEEVLLVVAKLLMVSFADIVEMEVECSGQKRSTSFELVSVSKFAELVMSERVFSTQRTEEGNLYAELSEHLVEYYQRGKRVPRPEEKLLVQRIIGLDRADFTVEEFVSHLLQSLKEGQYVEAVCLTSRGEEVLVRIPPLKKSSPQEAECDE